MNQTYHKIRERYYWKRMRRDITEYVHTSICDEWKINRVQTKTPLLISDTSLESFQKVSIDTVGVLPTTPSGIRHLLRMQCHFTKFVICVPLTDIRATTIADALARHVICQFGAPTTILSDQGLSFLSNIIAAMFRIFKIKHLITSSYFPSTNVMLERNHAGLLDFIRAYAEQYDDWDKLAPFACFSFNTSTHSATGYSPFELVYGCVARLLTHIPSYEKMRTYNIYLQDLI